MYQTVFIIAYPCITLHKFLTPQYICSIASDNGFRWHAIRLSSFCPYPILAKTIETCVTIETIETSVTNASIWITHIILTHQGIASEICGKRRCSMRKECSCKAYDTRDAKYFSKQDAPNSIRLTNPFASRIEFDGDLIVLRVCH